LKTQRGALYFGERVWGGVEVTVKTPPTLKNVADFEDLAYEGYS